MSSPTWQEAYEERSTTAVLALRSLRSGSRVFVGEGAGEPELLVAALAGMAPGLKDVEVLVSGALGPVPFADPALGESFRPSVLDPGAPWPGAPGGAPVDHIPAAGHRVAALFASGRLRPDVALLRVSPPDENGRVSLGVSVGHARAAADHARRIVVEVNPRMPRTCGDTLVPVARIDAFVHSDRPLPEVARPAPDEVERAIARHLARLVEDGSVLAAGQDAAAAALAGELARLGRRDLGLHTEVLTDELMDLMVSGVVTNARKTIDAGKTVAGACLGTRRLYELVRDNVRVELRGAEEVCDPARIGSLERMIALCRVDRVDLLGQSADNPGAASVRAGFVSRSSFLRGAATSRGGKAVVYLPSTSPDGGRSNIRVELDPGARRVGLAEEADWVATEWGVAWLRGRPVDERALALVEIAHPKFREGLLEGAKRLGRLAPDEPVPPSDGPPYSEGMEEAARLKGGLDVFFRPVRPSDERLVRTFLYALDERATYHRFHGELHRIDRPFLRQLIHVDQVDSVALVALLGSSADAPRMIGLGQSLRYPGMDRAELAFVTLEPYQNHGIASWILVALARRARERGLKHFVAEVLHGNAPMMRVFEKSGLPMRCKLADGVHMVELDI